MADAILPRQATIPTPMSPWACRRV